jgi:hypothetical protein
MVFKLSVSTLAINLSIISFVIMFYSFITQVKSICLGSYFC